MYHTVEAQSGRLHRAYEGVIQERPMARAYRVTDPVKLAAQLERAGFRTEIRGNLFRGARSPQRTAAWRHIVVAREPAARTVAETYERGVSLQCAHNGRVAFAARPEIVRVACENQFVYAPIRLAHTDPDIDPILADPVPFVRAMIDLADAPRERLEALRGVGYEQDLDERLHPRRRLHSLYRRAIAGTPLSWGRDLFCSLQGLTQTKSPTLVRAASLALTDFYPEFLMGVVSDEWAAASGLN